MHLTAGSSPFFLELIRARPIRALSLRGIPQRHSDVGYRMDASLSFLYRALKPQGAGFRAMPAGRSRGACRWHVDPLFLHLRDVVRPLHAWERELAAYEALARLFTLVRAGSYNQPANDRVRRGDFAEHPALDGYHRQRSLVQRRIAGSASV